MGEALHLSHDERLVLIKAARKVLDDAGFTEVPIIAGTGAGSTRETIQLCHEAAAAGVDYAIVITSGYYAGALANNKKALKDFFVEVSEKSPIPIMLYNCEFNYFTGTRFGHLTFTLMCFPPSFLSPDPGASGGIDLDSDLITEIATECPNTCGVKLTYVVLLMLFIDPPALYTEVDSSIFHRCGNVGKLTRVCATVSQPSFASAHPRKNSTAPFLVLGGFIDFLVPSTFANGHGAITGLANLAPVRSQSAHTI